MKLIKDPHMPIADYWQLVNEAHASKKSKNSSVLKKIVAPLESATKVPFFLIDHNFAKLVHASKEVQDFLPGLAMDVYGRCYRDSSQRILSTHYHFVNQISHGIVFRWLNDLDPKLRVKANFMLDYIVRNAQGELTRVLQKGMVVAQDAQGRVILTKYELHDITLYQTPDEAMPCRLIMNMGKDSSVLHYQYGLDWGEKEKKIKYTDWKAGIVKLLLKDYSVAQIADCLCVAQCTVETHVYQLRKMFACSSYNILLIYLRQLCMI